MLVIHIPLSDIDTGGRLRPPTTAVVESLALDIERRGLRTPVEVAEAGKKSRYKYRLVSGGHRCAAFAALGRESIPAIVVAGDTISLQRDEILENLARNELSALERVSFLAKLKDLYALANPEVKRGGDRRSAERGDQMAKLATWYAEVAARSDRSERTIRREAEIGAKLAADVIEGLRGSEIEDNQAELAALSKLGADRQRQVRDMLLAEYKRASSVNGALAVLDGKASPAASTEDQQFQKLMDVWNRANAKARARFLGEVGAEMVEAQDDVEVDNE
jgi:ParB family transcriptional regulator, chromosome partitioning protein